MGKGIKWTNLHPINLMKSIKEKGENVHNFPFAMLESYMKRVSAQNENQKLIISSNCIIDCSLIIYLHLGRNKFRLPR